VNQDAAFHTTIEVPGHGKAQVAAVFDGHGLLGEVAAEVAVKALEGLTSTLAWEEVASAPEAFMTALFEQLNAAVLEAHDSPPAQYAYTSGSTTLHFELKADADPTLGAMYICPEHDYMPPRPIDFGCTAVVAVCLGETMVVGNAGDAGGLLLRQNQPDCEDRDGYAVTFFTGKHTASSEAEQARIDRDFPNAAIFTPDGYLAPTDPVLSQYEVQLTRSLGHRLLRQAGVAANPDCFATTLDEAQSFALVICSDGVTDELSEGDILDRVTAAADAKDAALTLVRDAQNYCMDPDKIDDTTALVLLFGPEE
jgi:serine/threonine protein phosphatase PrpC